MWWTASNTRHWATVKNAKNIERWWYSYFIPSSSSGREENSARETFGKWCTSLSWISNSREHFYSCKCIFIRHPWDRMNQQISITYGRANQSISPSRFISSVFVWQIIHSSPRVRDIFYPMRWLNSQKVIHRSAKQKEEERLHPQRDFMNSYSLGKLITRGNFSSCFFFR